MSPDTHGRRWKGVLHACLLAVELAAAVALLNIPGTPLWTDATVMVGGAVLLAHTGRRFVAVISPSDAQDGEDNDVINATFAIVGTIYALLAGFVIVVVWQDYTDTEATVSREANAIANLERMSRGFPIPVQRQVQEAARTYARLVIDDEWRSMAHGEANPKAEAALAEIWTVYTDMPAAQRADPLYDQSVSALNELDDNRRARLLAGAGGLPTVMWALLCATALATIALSYLFYMNSSFLRQALTTSLAAVLALSLFLIATLQSPFGGPLPLHPDAFELALSHMKQLDQ